MNVPNTRSIAVVDLAARKQIASWSTNRAAANFLMAIEEPSNRVLVMFRHPPKLGVFDITQGAAVTTVDACGDSDDVFVDAKRHWIYASRGAGFIDVFDFSGSLAILAPIRRASSRVSPGNRRRPVSGRTKAAPMSVDRPRRRKASRGFITLMSGAASSLTIRSNYALKNRARM